MAYWEDLQGVARSICRHKLAVWIFGRQCFYFSFCIILFCANFKNCSRALLQRLAASRPCPSVSGQVRGTGFEVLMEHRQTYVPKSDKCLCGCSFELYRWGVKGAIKLIAHPLRHPVCVLVASPPPSVPPAASPHQYHAVSSRCFVRAGGGDSHEASTQQLEIFTGSGFINIRGEFPCCA